MNQRKTEIAVRSLAERLHVRKGNVYLRPVWALVYRVCQPRAIIFTILSDQVAGDLCHLYIGSTSVPAART